MIGELDWSDERFVRVFTRDTADWLALSYDAKGFYLQLRRKVDRAGVLDLGHQPHRALASILGAPEIMPHVDGWLRELEAVHALALCGSKLVLGHFIESEEAVSTVRLRQAESRARRRDLARTQRPDQLDFLDRPKPHPPATPEPVQGTISAVRNERSGNGFGEITFETSANQGPPHATDMCLNVISRNPQPLVSPVREINAESFGEITFGTDYSAHGEITFGRSAVGEAGDNKSVSAGANVSRFVTDLRRSVTTLPSAVTPSVLPSDPEIQKRSSALAAELLANGPPLAGFATEASQDPRQAALPHTLAQVALHVVREGSPSPPRSRPAQRKPIESSDSSRVEEIYRSEYEKATGEPPRRWGVKDRKHVRELLDECGFDRVVERLVALYRDPPAWMRRDGRAPDIGTLYSNFERLAPLRTPPSKKPAAHRPLRLSE